MKKTAQEENTSVVDLEDVKVISEPPEDLFLLQANQRNQLKRPPKHGEELARALMEGLQKRPSIADLADIEMEEIEQHIKRSEEATSQANQAYWQYRSLQDQALQSGHEYWSAVLKAWNVIKGVIAANPSVVADFPEIYEHFNQHGAKVSAGKRQSQQTELPKKE